jgi:hypothetical protein
MELPFAIVFSAIDHLSDTLGRIGEGLLNVGNRAQEAGEHLADVGERMVNFGARMGLGAALISEGATRLHEWSDALQEPAQAMQKNMATMAAMTGLAGDQLESIKRRALDFAASHPGATAEEWVAGFTRMRGIFQDTAQAMGAEDIVAMLKRLGVENDAATRLIQVGWSNLRTDAATTGDELTRTIQAFGLAPEQASQFAAAVGRMGASAAAAHAPFSEVLALSGEAQGLLGGGRGATMFASMIQGLESAAAKGKANIDFSHGLVAALQELKSQLSGTPTEKLAELAKMGLGAQGPQLLNLLGNLDQVAAKQKQIADSSGALSAAYGTATANMADATQRLHQNWSNLGDALSSPALGIQARATNVLSDAVESLSKHLENHSRIAGVAAIALTGIGSAAYHGVEAMSALGTMSVFAGRGFQAVKGAMALLDFESMALRFMYAKDAIAGVASATNLWAAAQWLLDAALSPLGIAVISIAAIGVTAYEVYEHWSTVKGWLEGFGSWLASWAPTIGKYVLIGLTGPLGLAAIEIYQHWDSIKKIFDGAVDWLKTAGLNMMKSLGEGILAGIEYPFKAAEQIAEKIGGFFHFHSPPAYGPLREAVTHFHFGEELAKHMQPWPAIGAATAMAAGIALAVPAPVLHLPSNEFAHPAAEVAPITLEMAPVMMAERVGRRTAAGTPAPANATGGIVIHYSPNVTVNGASGSPEDWLKAMRQHSDELMRVIDSKLNRRSRLEFE